MKENLSLIQKMEMTCRRAVEKLETVRAENLVCLKSHTIV